MVPLRLVAAVALLLVLAVLGRRWVGMAARETAAGFSRHVRTAGPLHLAALGVILALGAWLRWDSIDVPMRWDESYTFLFYGLPRLSVGLSKYDAPNNHVFHTFLLHLSYVLFGGSHRAVRAPALAAGCLVPLAAYVAALRLYGRHAALIVAALAAGSAQLVEYSTNARGYTIEALLALVLLALAPSLLRSRNPTYWALFSVVGALGLYTVPVFIYPFLPIVAAIAVAALLGHFEQPLRRTLISLVASTAAAFAFAALLYGPIVSTLAHWAGVPGYTSAESMGHQLWRLWTLGLPGPFKILLVIGFVVSALAAWNRSTSRLPLAAVLAVAAAIVVAAGRVAPYSRYFVAILPLALIAAVGGLLGWDGVKRTLSRRVPDLSVSVVAAAIAIALVVVVSVDNLADQEASALPSANRIAGLVGPRLSGNDVLLVSVCAWPIEAYSFYDRGWSPFSVIGTESQGQAAHGRSYVVVNKSCGETLSSVLASGAPGSGLEPQDGRKLASFPGATVYEFAPTRS